MDKLKMQAPDLTDKNIEQIAALFPNVITETKDENGNLKKAVDFDLLKQVLSKNLVEADDERYRLDWPGKKASLLKANMPITKTLRPCREESVNFDNTENLYIEGDNFEVLKILQESYLGKVKMMCIDPPYNTGNDFIYKDDFKKSKEEYEEELGVEDEDGGKLFKNTDSNGRFHSDWLSMMYERLVVARDLLRDDGVIFISIDDNEVHNLRKICDEIFGESSFVAQLVWEKKKKGAFLSGAVTNVKEYLIVYVKAKESFLGLIGEIARSEETYPVIKTTNSRGVRIIKKGITSKFRENNHHVPKGTRISSGNMEMILLSDMVIKNNILTEDVIVDSNWIYSQDLLNKYADDKSLYVTQDLYFRRVVTEPRTKMLKDLLPMKGEETTGFDFKITDNLFNDGWGTNEDGFDELHNLLGAQSLMSFPKPSKLIAKLALSTTRFDQEALVLDFFSGSSTTAHAVIQLNAEDGGKRKFIMVQLPEKTDENSEAYKAGYKTIAEIGKERIRRAGKKILSELESKSQQLKLGEEPVDASKLDIGFRVYKTDSTNMKDVFYHPSELKQMTLDDLLSNIKEDRTPEDLLTQVILDLGLELSLPIETKKILGNTVFIVQTNALVACFDNDIDFKIVDTIAGLKPFKVVFKDASFKDDKDRINVEERFKRLSPETKVTVI